MLNDSYNIIKKSHSLIPLTMICFSNSGSCLDTINGAKTSAMIYSIAETAKANNLKPYDYFEHLLE